MKRKTGLWAYIILGVVAISLATGCATYGVLKKEVFPGIKQVIVAAGPNLIGAIIQDAADLIGDGADLAEDSIDSLGILPPAPTPQ